MSDYNGWSNKETWLVNLWYIDSMPEYYTDADQYYVEPNELEEAITYIFRESETLFQTVDGLIGDFISTSWSRVNWHELADALNETLAATEEDNDSIEF